MQETKETQVWSLGQEDPLEKGMATHSSILAWRIPWTEESGGLQGHKELDPMKGLNTLVFTRNLLTLLSFLNHWLSLWITSTIALTSLHFQVKCHISSLWVLLISLILAYSTPWVILVKTVRTYCVLALGWRKLTSVLTVFTLNSCSQIVNAHSVKQQSYLFCFPSFLSYYFMPSPHPLPILILWPCLTLHWENINRSGQVGILFYFFPIS